MPEAKDALKHYLWGREIVDLLADFPSVTFTPAEFVGHLRKLHPRLYSISSSLNAFPGPGASHDRRGALRELRAASAKASAPRSSPIA